MLVNTWSKPAAPFAPRSGTMSMGWVGARGARADAAVDAAAAALIDMANWGPASAMAALATKTIPDLRIRMCRPFPRPVIRGPDYLVPRRAGQPATRTLPRQLQPWNRPPCPHFTTVPRALSLRRTGKKNSLIIDIQMVFTRRRVRAGPRSRGRPPCG